MRGREFTIDGVNIKFRHFMFLIITWKYRLLFRGQWIFGSTGHILV